MRTLYDVTGEYTTYSPVTLTFVTVRPDTRVTVTGATLDGMVGHMNPIEQTDDNHYTSIVAGVFQGIRNGVGFDAFVVEVNPEIVAKCDSYAISTFDNYLFVIENRSNSTPSTPSTPSAAPSFADVPTNAYYADAVNWAVSKAITNGTSTTAFSPEENCTQAQILTFLWRAAGKPTLNLGILPTWVDEAYQEAVLWAAYTDMIDIVTFDPDKPCTRSTAVSYIWQALDRPTPTTSARFTDVSQSTSYAQAVSWAVGASVTNGTSTTTFSPNDTCTRGQIVTFLYRAMG